MFSRYSICSEPNEIKDTFSASVPSKYVKKFNAAPSHLLPVITDSSQEGISIFYWGSTPEWKGKNQLIEKFTNIPLEENLNTKLFQKRVKKTCIIPADGFYLWKKSGKKSQIPYRFTWMERDLFCFPGIWEEYDNDNDQIQHTFLIITTKIKDPQYSQFDNLFPVILSPKQGKEWLEHSDASKLLQSQKEIQRKLNYYPVSQKINSAENNESSLIQKSQPIDQFGAISLFE